MRPHNFTTIGGLRLLTALFPLLPLVVGCITNLSEPVPLGTALGAAVLTVELCAMPVLLRFHRLFGAVWHLAFNTIAAAVLFSVLTTKGFPNLATCLAVLKTDAGEASHMLWAMRYSVATVAVAWLLQLPGCVSLARRPPDFAISASRWRIVGLVPLVLPLLAPSVAQLYPGKLFELVLQVGQFRYASEHVNRDYSFDVKVRTARTESLPPELVVFVIGESSQADYWQLYGYPEPSTPEMVRRRDAGELLVFNRHMATASATRVAVPALLSPFADLLPPPEGSRPSLVTVMAKAGYDTAWLSVQGPLPQSSEADKVLFTSDSEVLGAAAQYDNRLLEQAAAWTKEHHARPGFLVLHTAGSHLPYEARYPATAARWHGHEGKDFPKSQTVGSYLNTVLYTDSFLTSLMTQMAHEPRPVVLVYLSDHGEASMKGLSRDQVRLEHVMHVPFLMWGNAQWRKAHQNEWAEVQRAALTGQVTNHLNVVPTLTTILGVDYDGKPFERDLLSAKFNPWTRTPAIRVQTMERVEITPPK